MHMKLIKKGKEFPYIQDEFERDYPGPITNNRLLKDFTKYLREDDPTNPCNYQVKTKILEGRDYKLMPPKCWEILKARFEGFELKRFKEKGYYSSKYMIRFQKVSMLSLIEFHVFYRYQS